MVWIAPFNLKIVPVDERTSGDVYNMAMDMNTVNVRLIVEEEVSDLPLGETMTGCDLRASPSGRFSDITSTEPRLVPTHKLGDVTLSVTSHVRY